MFNFLVRIDRNNWNCLHTAVSVFIVKKMGENQLADVLLFITCLQEKVVIAQSVIVWGKYWVGVISQYWLKLTSRLLIPSANSILTVVVPRESDTGSATKSNIATANTSHYGNAKPQTSRLGQWRDAKKLSTTPVMIGIETTVNTDR